MPIDTNIAAWIPEGWTLIKDKPLSHIRADAHLRVVLAGRDVKGKNREFVTWVANTNTPECFHGHYYGELLPALRDYAAR